MITSSGNPRVKSLKSLSLKKFRQKEKKFSAEGFHLIGEALSAPEFKIESIFFSKKALRAKEGADLIKKAAKAAIELIEVSDPVMKSLSEVEEPQGMVACIRMREASIDDLTDSASPLIAVCVGIQDPGNLGTIVRSVDALSGTGILAGSGSADIYNPKALRASMGSVFHLPIVEFDDVMTGIKRLKEKGVNLVATSLGASEQLKDLDLTRATAIVFGSEGAGLPLQVLQSCGHVIKIPMRGKAESLNVGSAATIIFYEALRQREING
jgi:TrmH family RNA methyltransferase